jgi:phosphate starvation-inducible membrane PsiE
MTFVGICSYVFAGLTALFALLLAKHQSAMSTGVSFLQAALLVLAGFWTHRAATSIKLIVTTSGNDIPHLMDGMENLRKLFTMYMIVMIVALVLIGAMFLLAFGAAAKH